MALFSSSNSSEGIQWFSLENHNQLEEFKEKSFEIPVMIFKHSTRCSLSFMAKNRIESAWQFENEDLIPVYLDLLSFRNISNLIADEFRIVHESPQVIVLKNGQSIYSASHGNISVEAIKDSLC